MFFQVKENIIRPIFFFFFFEKIRKVMVMNEINNFASVNFRHCGKSEHFALDLGISLGVHSSKTKCFNFPQCPQILTSNNLSWTHMNKGSTKTCMQCKDRTRGTFMWHHFRSDSEVEWSKNRHTSLFWYLPMNLLDMSDRGLQSCSYHLSTLWKLAILPVLKIWVFPCNFFPLQTKAQNDEMRNRLSKIFDLADVGTISPVPSEVEINNMHVSHFGIPFSFFYHFFSFAIFAYIHFFFPSLYMLFSFSLL